MAPTASTLAGAAQAFRPPPGLPPPAWMEAGRPVPPPGLGAAGARGSQAAAAVCPPPGLPAAEDLQAAPLKPLARNVTTLVIQNLPGRYSQDDILALWPIDGTYDYMHVPYNLLQKRALGYVFINFLSNELAAAFQRRWHGSALPGGGGAPRRPLDVGAAEVQGRQANLELIKSRKIGQLSKAGYLPLVLEQGQRVDVRALLAAGAAKAKVPVVQEQPQQPQPRSRKEQSLSSKESAASSDSDATTTISGASACDLSWVDDASSQEGDSLPEPMYVMLRV